MKKGGGKQKGASYEREVCKRLSLWLTKGKRQDCLWRSAMSGGRATVAHAKGVKIEQVGDIAAVSPEGHRLTNRYYIELKHVKQLDFGSFVLKRTGRLATYWRTTKTQALKHGRAPMIIAKQNLMPDIVMVLHGGFVPLIGMDPKGIVIDIERPNNYHWEIRLLEDVLANDCKLRKG
jgi:hypothetical protein